MSIAKDYDEFLSHLERSGVSKSDIALLSVYAKHYDAWAASRFRSTDLERSKRMFGVDRAGYVTFRQVIDAGQGQAHAVMQTLGFQEKNVYVGAVKTRCWVRGWTDGNLTQAIASGQLPNLMFPPPPPVPLPPPPPSC